MASKKDQELIDKVFDKLVEAPIGRFAKDGEEVNHLPIASVTPPEWDHELVCSTTEQGNMVVCDLKTHKVFYLTWAEVVKLAIGRGVGEVD